MPANLTPVDAWPANFQIPADGDAVSQATQSNVMQEFSDASTYLYNRSIESKGGSVIQPMTPVDALVNFAWDFGPPRIEQSGVGAAGSIYIPIDGYYNCKLSAVTVTLQGSAGHGALPATMPQVSVWEMVPSTGTNSVLAPSPVVDTSASVAAYEAIHTIVVTLAVALAMDYDSVPYIKIEGETGAGSQVGLDIYGIYLTLAAS